jgi:hypothetical protein
VTVGILLKHRDIVWLPYVRGPPNGNQHISVHGDVEVMVCHFTVSKIYESACTLLDRSADLLLDR